MRSKLLLAAALAIVALTATAGSASAASFEITNPGTFTTSSSAVTFSASGFINIICPLTLNGSTEAGLKNKVAGTRFGTLSEVRIGTCTGGRVNRVLTPFNLQYSSIAGTLPSAVTSLEFSVANAGFELENGEIACLYSGAVFARTAVTGTNPYTTSGTMPITRDTIGGGSGFCAFLSGSMTGTFSAVTPAIRIRRL